MRLGFPAAPEVRWITLSLGGDCARRRLPWDCARIAACQLLSYGSGLGTFIPGVDAMRCAIILPDR
jgi:hypothetical protein